MTQPEQKPLGKNMLIIGWCIGIGILVLAFGRWEDQQYNPNQSLSNTSETGVREVTLASNRYHHYVATGTINGKDAVFLLDTGATYVSVPAGLARDLGLERGRESLASTANGVVTVYDTRINTLTLGPIQLYNVTASINPGMDGEEILLGMSALRQLELVQKDNQLTLRQYAN